MKQEQRKLGENSLNILFDNIFKCQVESQSVTSNNVLLGEQITCIFGMNRAHCDTSIKVGMGHIYGH